MKKIYRILGKKGRTTIPYPLRTQIGFHTSDLLSFHQDGDVLVIRREKVCDNCGQGDEKELLTVSEELREFVTSLPIEAQRELFLHLSLHLMKETSGRPN